jgi:hypothetical protein
MKSFVASILALTAAVQAQVECEPGEFSTDSGLCQPCPEDYFSIGGVASECYECPQGEECIDGILLIKTVSETGEEELVALTHKNYETYRKTVRSIDDYIIRDETTEEIKDQTTYAYTDDAYTEEYNASFDVYLETKTVEYQAWIQKHLSAFKFDEILAK